jgi:RNA polymerase sigma-70 factor (ECF subfamily)
MTDTGTPQPAWPPFEAVIRAHDRDLRAFAGRLLAGTTVAVDDVLQDAYLEAFRATENNRRSDESFGRAHLFRLVHWRSLDALRSDRRRVIETAEEETEPDQLEDHRPTASERQESREDVARALAVLTFEARAILLLVDGAGFTYSEAAELIDVPEGTVASRLHHARSRFRLEIEKGREKSNA